MPTALAPPPMDKKTVLLQKAAGDSRLSVEAVGLLTMLCLNETALELATRPPELAKYMGVGQTKAYTLLKTLQGAGYIRKWQSRTKTETGAPFGGNKIKILD